MQTIEEVIAATEALTRQLQELNQKPIKFKLTPETRKTLAEIEKRLKALKEVMSCQASTKA